MLTVDVRGMGEVQRMLCNLATEQMPYAISTALNSTAFAVQKTERQRLPSVFDRPTPLIKGALRVEKSTKQNLTAVVYADPKRAAILKTHEVGGPRSDQKLERYLRGKGWLASGWRAVPTDKMKLNSYGNPAQAEVNKIIAGLPSISGIRGDRRRHFVVPAGRGRGLSPGIYRRGAKTGLLKLYHFVSQAVYSPRWGFEAAAHAQATRELPDLMSAAIDRAIRTAR